MRRLNLQRFTLALVSTLALIAAGVGVFMALHDGKTLDAVAVGLLTLLVRELGGGKAMAFSWFFDGSADKPPPAPGTATTTSTAIVDTTAPTGKPDDPVTVTEVPPTSPKGTP
jgi:hypothetical protein